LFSLGINATPVDNDMRIWNALIDGPADTCYEDGLFTLRMEFTGRKKPIKKN
jgi:ubiquitin-conjugating enzyme E2 A